MIYTTQRKICAIMLFLLATLSFGQTTQQDELLNILKNEINREMGYLKKADIPVYLLSYRIDETEWYVINTSFGVLTSSRWESKERYLTVQVRVGDKNLDNFHELRDDSGPYSATIPISLDNNTKAIASSLWSATEEAYKNAILRYEKAKASIAIKVESEDKAPDYSEAASVQYYEPLINISDLNFNETEWEARLKSYSREFVDIKDILNGTSTLWLEITRKYYVNSEGTSIVQNSTSCRVGHYAMVLASDGMELPLFQSYFAHTPAGLPDNNTMLQDAKKLAQTLVAIKTAPIVEPYAGPAILSSDAAGVFFHEVFGHRVEGQRMKKESDGQIFKKKIGEMVLHKDFSVIFDPTITYYKNNPLNGSYKYDDEGVKAEKIIVIDKGVLKDFLMTRTPIDNFPKSNGHARAQAGEQPVSRQSNLIVETEKPYTDAQLREMLIAEVKKQNKEYGFLFAKVQGGFTLTERFIPNSFNIMPLEVYRIYADGRPDELVRGVDLIGTPLSMFSQVEAAGDTHGNFAGTCGAESGWVPVGCSSPALFVKQIEMQKKEKEQNLPPIIERP